MNTIKILGLPLLFLIYMVLSIPILSCDPDDDDDDECDSCIVVYKPNIYIYPKEQIELSVKISFPMGGKIVMSIPEYGNGWNVLVDTSGLINNTYSYLFYESTQPDVWQRNYGWTIRTEELESFFKTNLSDYGFNNREINDFIDYWIPRLKDYPVYSIYPQTKEIIDNVIQLDLSKQYDSILRLFYVIKGHYQLQDKLIAPAIDIFIRDGYVITEWGVLLI